MPLFELPIEENKHSNYEWSGQGRGVDSFALWSYHIWVQLSRQFCRRLVIIHFVLSLYVCQASRALWQKCPYYINTNKIPGKLLRQNVMRNLSESSNTHRKHVKLDVKNIVKWQQLCILHCKEYLNFYEITNELGELLCENMISSHMKITCYLQTWKDRCCYGYIINSIFRCQKYLSEMVFHWCAYNKIIKHYMAALFLYWKIFHLLANIFHHSKTNFVSTRGRVYILRGISFK